MEDNTPVGMLIGASCAEALESLEILQSRNERPSREDSVGAQWTRTIRTQYPATKLL